MAKMQQQAQAGAPAMDLAGRFFDGSQSRAHAACLRVAGGQVAIIDADGRTLFGGTAADMQISSRLGRTPRQLRFANGGVFETDDNDAVDAWQAASHAPRTHGLVHRLESRLRYVVAGIVVVVALGWAGVQWGIPALARVTAFALPPQAQQEAEKLMLSILGRGMLAPSELGAEEQARLQAVFAPVIAAGAADAGTTPLSVRFYHGDSIGANAMALPGGMVIFTDQLVRRAEHDEELIGILAHEIGHVVHRHGLQRAIQGSALSLLAALLLGDVSSVSSAVAALPLILTEMGYSRDFEREADRYAVDTLVALGIPPQRLADILQRIAPDDAEDLTYLSTHPPTQERLRTLRAPPAAP